MDRSKKLGMVTVLASISLIAGCFASNPEDIQAWVRPYEVNVTAENYAVQPPDEIEIHCSQVAEVHMQRQRIRPDGKVSFEVLGEIDVAGKTPTEIAAVIGERIKELYTLPGDIPWMSGSRSTASKVYYVVGQVVAAGAPQLHRTRQPPDGAGRGRTESHGLGAASAGDSPGGPRG